DAVLVEKSASIRELGERFSASLGLARIAWIGEEFPAALRDLEPCDLVTLAYVLDEIDEDERDELIDRLWQVTRDVLILVEPGTTAGWQRILSARDRLIAAGA